MSAQNRPVRFGSDQMSIRWCLSWSRRSFLDDSSTAPGSLAFASAGPLSRDDGVFAGARFLESQVVCASCAVASSGRATGEFTSSQRRLSRL